MAITFSTPRLFPIEGPAPTAIAAGFRFGPKGTHSSRTLMFAELASLLTSTSASTTRDGHADAIIRSNCLAKPTSIGRRRTNQRIGELYALDPAVAVFRIFRRLWDVEQAGRELLAIQCAAARDPLLAATVPAILVLPIDGEFSRDEMAAAVRDAVGERLNDGTIAKVVRNAASSWTQSGHLSGRTFKRRRKVNATTASIAFGLYLAHAAGFRGADLFSSAWIALHDCTPGQARQLAVEAKRIGLIDLRASGDVIEINLDRLDPTQP